ncbi:MAG TPA: TetR family transcriptional regulator C-terminal domain-containing protein, partial [Actinomycetes bacterium]|nr:TetR family transcriptional regulator C-terminal domain-containing protein [Actinomycetes bacterium]
MTLAAKDPEERRRRILQAAVEVLRARGFSGTRVADIAAAAGTSPALVLYHFSSLREVLVAALASVDEQFYADLEVGDQSDARNQLARMAALAAEGGPAFGDWQLWLEVWVRARHDERIDEVRRSLDERWRAELRDVVSAGVRQGVFTSGDPATAALRLAALMDGLAVQVVLDEPDMTPARMVVVWLEGAALELGASAADLCQRA